jgi:hypothetical protein
MLRDATPVVGNLGALSPFERAFSEYWKDVIAPKFALRPEEIYGECQSVQAMGELTYSSLRLAEDKQLLTQYQEVLTPRQPKDNQALPAEHSWKLQVCTGRQDLDPAWAAACRRTHDVELMLDQPQPRSP